MARNITDAALRDMLERSRRDESTNGDVLTLHQHYTELRDAVISYLVVDQPIAKPTSGLNMDWNAYGRHQDRRREARNVLVELVKQDRS